MTRLIPSSLLIIGALLLVNFASANTIDSTNTTQLEYLGDQVLQQFIISGILSAVNVRFQLLARYNALRRIHPLLRMMDNNGGEMQQEMQRARNAESKQSAIRRRPAWEACHQTSPLNTLGLIALIHCADAEAQHWSWIETIK